jgi:hypothetical protein
MAVRRPYGSNRQRAVGVTASEARHSIVRRTATRLVSLLALLIVGLPGQAGDVIYRSYDKSGSRLPLYTDRAIGPSSRQIASVEDESQRRIFTLIPGVVTPSSRVVPRLSPGTTENRALAARRDAIEPVVQRAALKHGVDAALLKAVIEVESGFNALARSPKGASGLMQLMPATVARYGRVNLFSPEENIDAGTRYLRDLLAQFGGNVRLAIAAYNAGENAVIRHGNRIPSFPETLKYVPMVLERYDHYRRSGKSSAPVTTAVE